MTQEDKQLLIKDLCARSPYGVKIKVRSNDIRTVRSVDMVEGIVHFVESDSISPFGIHIEHPTTFCQVVKPYLRPVSSMTEKERKEINKSYNFSDFGNITIRYHMEGWWDNDTECSLRDYLYLINWLNEHHFDYQGLIEKGLALEAPEDMYKNIHTDLI